MTSASQDADWLDQPTILNAAGAALVAELAALQSSPTTDAEQQAGAAEYPTAAPVEITQPGVYDIPEADYHRDPVPDGSLSSTEIKRLNECPARYWHHKHGGGSDFKDVFDFGKAAHHAVLGVGGQVVVCDFDDWRTKDARAMRDEVRAAGGTPLLAGDWETVDAMAQALKAHPVASALLDPTRGKPEQSLFWQAGGVWRRARLDWLPEVVPGQRLIIPDYKTCPDASAEAFSKSVANYGYHIQEAWYTAAVEAVLGVRDPAFVFIAQEKVAPYLVNVIELHPYARQIGRVLCEEAVEVYLTCKESGEWPGYSLDVEQINLPRWAEMSFEETHG